MTNLKDSLLQACFQALDNSGTVVWVTLILICETESESELPKADEKLLVPKFLLELSSPVFLAAFKDNTFANSITNEYIVVGYAQTIAASAIGQLKGARMDSHVQSFDTDAIDFYLEIYLFANEYQMNSLKQEVVARLRRWMKKLWADEDTVERGFHGERPMFDQLFQRIITLYDETALQASENNHNSLLVGAAKFYWEYRPGTVMVCCKSSESKYKIMAQELSNWYEELEEECYHEYDCDCDPCIGEWDDDFVEWLEEYVDSVDTWDKWTACE